MLQQRGWDHDRQTGRVGITSDRTSGYVVVACLVSLSNRRDKTGVSAAAVLADGKAVAC